MLVVLQSAVVSIYGDPSLVPGHVPVLDCGYIEGLLKKDLDGAILYPHILGKAHPKLSFSVVSYDCLYVPRRPAAFFLQPQ